MLGRRPEEVEIRTLTPRQACCDRQIIVLYDSPTQVQTAVVYVV